MLNKRIILASNSPRRIALLKTLGYPFDVVPHDTEECVSYDVSPDELVQQLACQKAEDVAQRVENAVVIGADTIVLLNHCVLGKPIDASDARRMLS
ncbi:MAG: Maf family protein, partial [Planctomycetes bacterium]|nr:Maf family protein [Planctomycetota bacterium]